MSEIFAFALFSAQPCLRSLALGACRDSGTDGEGKLFEISGKLFVFNYRVATATYVVTLRPAAADGRGPDRGRQLRGSGRRRADLVIEQKVWPKLDKVTIESPPLACVVKDHPYAVSIRIEGLGRRGPADDRHDA